jgi:hypothetical protein
MPSVGNAVTRVELYDAVYRRVGLSRSESASFVELVLTEITDSMARGETRRPALRRSSRPLTAAGINDDFSAADHIAGLDVSLIWIWLRAVRKPWFVVMGRSQ